MGCMAIGSKRKFGFDQSCAFIGLCDSETEAIPISRPGTDVPELRQVLRCVEELRAARLKTIRTLPDRSIFGTIRLYEPK